MERDCGGSKGQKGPECCCHGGNKRWHSSRLRSCRPDGSKEVLSALLQGTLMPVFQPGEETAQGAQAMIDDALFQRFTKPDVVLGQHVTRLPSGHLDWRTGVVTSAADS